MKTLVDSGGAIDEDKIELRGQRIEHQPHGLRGNIPFGRGMVAGEYVEISEIGMPDKRLFGAAPALDDVHDIVHDEIFHPGDHVHIVQPEIGVAENDPLPAPGKLCAEVGGNGGFPHAALSRRNDDFPCHTYFTLPFSA